MNEVNVFATADNSRYIFLLFPFVGISLFVGGFIYRRRLKKKIVGCERTSGTVIDNVSSPSPGSSTGVVYAPVVEYFVQDKRFKVTDDVSSYPPKAIGTKLNILFRPANPSEAYVEKDYYIIANIMLIAGAAFLTFGSAFVYVYAFRQ